MSSNALHRLTEKKGRQLSKFLGIDSVPSTRLIANMQSRINNPLFKLSMTDYEDMCGNKMMIRMMSKVIGCEEKQLKKFCKYINVFAENIESSPKSIKNKMKIRNSINTSKRKGSLSVLPEDILEKIVNKYKTIFKIKYKLKDWIPLEKLDWNYLSSNPNAIDLLKENPTKIFWTFLSANPAPYAIELLKENQKRIDWFYLSGNSDDKAIELLREYIENIEWDQLSRNPNPNAIKLLKENPSKINWEELSSNPNAIDLIKNKINEENDIGENLDNSKNINYSKLSTNPNAIELLKEYPNKIDWKWLSENPNPEAIELLKENQHNIDWFNLSINPNPEAIKLLKANQHKIDWYLLSRNRNPEAIKLLKTKPNEIDWDELSANPAIFDEVLE